MGLLASRMARFRAADWAPSDDRWYGVVDSISAAGLSVTPDTSMRSAAVLRCVLLLANTIASMPLKIYRWLPDGGKQEAPNHPLYELLHTQPNRWQTSFEFRHVMQCHLELRGNAYAEIIAGPRGFADQLIPRHPDRITVKVEADGAILYDYRAANAPKRTILQDDMFHLRGYSQDGVIGLSPVAVARDVIGIGLAQQDYAGRYLKNDATPPLVLKHPQHFKDKEAYEKFRESWQAAQTGANRGKVAILEDGLTVEKIGLSNKDSQFIEERQLQIEDIARIFGVPPHKIGHLLRATNNNIEHQGIEYKQDSILPRAVNWEQSISRSLILATSYYFAAFNLDGLERGDIASRYQAYNSAINSGWITRNEVRARENLNALDGLDEPLTPLNMAPASAPPPPAVPPKRPTPPEEDGENARERLRQLAQIGAERCVRREVAALNTALMGGSADFAQAVRDFYGKHAGFIVSALRIDPALAESYCAANLVKIENDPAAITEISAGGIAALTAAAMGERE